MLNTQKLLFLHLEKLVNIINQVVLGVRVDSAIYQGYSIPPHYDSMIAKLITYGEFTL